MSNQSASPRHEPLVLLSPLHRAIRQIGIHLSEEMSDLDLPGNEGHILSYLGSYAPVPISDLVRVFGIKKSTLTSLLDRLESRRLIRRELHPSDRRSFLVHVTEEGEDLAAVVRRRVEALEQGICRSLAPSDLAAFGRVMESIASHTQVEVRSNPKESK